MTAVHAVVALLLLRSGPGRHRQPGWLRRVLRVAGRRDHAGLVQARVAWFTRPTTAPCAGCGNPSVERLCSTCVLEGWELAGGMLVYRSVPVERLARRQECLDTVELPVLAAAVADRDAAELLLPGPGWVSPR